MLASGMPSARSSRRRESTRLKVIDGMLLLRDAYEALSTGAGEDLGLYRERALAYRILALALADREARLRRNWRSTEAGVAKMAARPSRQDVTSQRAPWSV